jgi:hypothetical protein
MFCKFKSLVIGSSLFALFVLPANFNTLSARGADLRGGGSGAYGAYGSPDGYYPQDGAVSGGSYGYGGIGGQGDTYGGRPDQYNQGWQGGNYGGQGSYGTSYPSYPTYNNSYPNSTYQYDNSYPTPSQNEGGGFSGGSYMRR